MKKTSVDFIIRFPMYHVCPKCLAHHLCGSAFLQNGFTFRQDLGQVGKTLVDWERGIVHCVLIQHLKKSLESFMQLISFCSSCILPVSSRLDEFFVHKLRESDETIQRRDSLHKNKNCKNGRFI